jgi:hypothetical protein
MRWIGSIPTLLASGAGSGYFHKNIVGRTQRQVSEDGIMWMNLSCKRRSSKQLRKRD